ncbi:MAG: TrkA family potassium uptake protein [Coprobacillus sp.]
MMKEKQYVVLGLGVFGSTIVKTLSQFDCEVLAIDKDEECVLRVSEFATKAVVGDITDQQFLRDLGISEFDVGVVAIGNHLEESLLGCLNLKEIGVPYIIAKAKNKRFKAVLEKIGADRVVRPEKEMGERIARSLLRKNITDLVEIDDSYSIVEMKVPLAWVGHSLSNLDLRKNYGINILGQRDKETHKLSLSVEPNHIIEIGDHFLMIAETQKVEKFDYLVHE